MNVGVLGMYNPQKSKFVQKIMHFPAFGMSVFPKSEKTNKHNLGEGVLPGFMVVERIYTYSFMTVR